LHRLEEMQGITAPEGSMNNNPLMPMVEMGSPTPPSPNKERILHWDGYNDVRQSEESRALSAPTFPSSFQANGQSAAALRTHPYLTTDEIGLVPSGALREIVWEQEATFLTFAFDPVLLAGITYEELPRVTGELMWTPCHDQSASFAPSVHPVLLIHSFHEVCPVHRIEIVPDLKGCDPLLQHMALVLQIKIEEEGINGRFYVESLVDALAVHFLRRFGVTCHSLNNGHDGLSLYKLRRTLAYIRAHLAQELSLVTLAAVEKTSPAHFARLFKSATGLAPHQYVIACRIAEAKRLLAKTEDTLVNIGSQVGCPDQSHFTALFHKHVGFTPKAYRDSIKS
jgi:AraC family transcriptional regulator